MSACDVRIKLDHPEAVYAPGDVIGGFVLVRANAPCECRKLNVKLAWRTDGESNSDVGKPLQEQTLTSGRWKQGEIVGYRFDLTAPPGPFSYQGHHFNVGWYIQASADLASLADAHAEKLVQVVPGGNVAQVDFGPKSAFVDDVVGTADARLSMKSRDTRGATGWFMGCLAIPLSVFLLATFVGGTMFAYDSLRQGRFNADLLWMVLMLPMLGLVGISYGRYVLRPILARSRVGSVDVKLSTRRLEPGEEVAYTVTCRPQLALELDRLSVKLVAREEATHGYGRSTRVWYHVAFECENVESARSIRSGETVVWQGVLRVPEGAPSSFFASNNELIWSVDVQLAADKWTDWQSRHFIVVGPPVGQPIAVASSA